MQLFLNPRFRLYIGAILISFSPIFVSLVDVSPTVSAFYRVFIGGVVLILFSFLKKQKFEFNKVVRSFLVMSAFFFAADLWFWHRSVIYLGSGLGTLLANMQVFVMMLAGFLIFKQTPSRLQLISIPIAITGLIMIIGIDWNTLKPDYQIGIIFGLLTAVCYSGYLISMRQAQQGSNFEIPVREVAVMSLLVSLILGITAFFENESLLEPSSYDYLILFLYGIGSHAMGGIMIASALIKVRAAEVGIALLLQPALSFVWEIIIFNKAFSLVEGFGVIIVLLAIFLSSNRTSH